MKTPTLSSLALLAVSFPLPGGYAIFVARGSEIRLVDKQNGGVAGANLIQTGNSDALISGEVQLIP